MEIILSNLKKVEIILSKVSLHHNTSAISLKYPSFIFQFDPTRINQAFTTRHIFDLDHFSIFPFIINFVRLSERDEVYQGKAFTRDDVAFLFSFTLVDMDVYC